MTPDELRKSCESRELVVLHLPFRSRGARARLCKTWGPYGQILCQSDSDHEPRCVAAFKSKDILAWLDKQEDLQHWLPKREHNHDN